jgi:small-conductance mechanosensitive channel
MENWWPDFVALLEGGLAVNVISAAIKIVLGVLVAAMLARALGKMMQRAGAEQRELLVKRLVFYLVLGLFVISALSDFGLDLKVLLGAAGILTVAIGFAAQTSASNLISGLFLLGEKPFSIGDIINVGETTGIVMSVDLLSAKLRTFQNLYVRIPNETLIKSEITNISRYPIRRVDIELGVAYKEDLDQVRAILMDVADKNTSVLEEPAPVFIFDGFGDSALTFRFCVWITMDNWFPVRTEIQLEIKKAFDANGIEIPFPHRTIYTGSVTEPFPVQVTGTEGPETHD